MDLNSIFGLLFKFSAPIIEPLQKKIYSPVINKLEEMFPKSKQTIMQHRLRVKKQFLDNYGENWTKHEGEFLIRDIDQMDVYLDYDKFDHKKPAFFEVEVKELYENGIEVFIDSLKEVTFQGDPLLEKCTTFKQVENGIITANAYTVGQIPFDFIEDIDWHGDKHYPMPHIFCKFKKKGFPYEKIVYCVEIERNAHTTPSRLYINIEPIEIKL